MFKKRLTMLVIAAVMLSACSGKSVETVSEVPALPSETDVVSGEIKEEEPAADPKEEAEETVAKQQEETDKEEEEQLPPSDKHVRMRLDGSGSDVFALWGNGRPDYRYGPSMILNDDDSIDVWFASPGDGKKEYDWIIYRHSDDGGETWGDEKVVLSPTPGSADFKSVCDPDVFFYDGYYYMGYTATVNSDGLCNNVFLARSKNPDGPYEKWDGAGWGGTPVPIIYFKGVDIGWGVGEPSFVIVDDKLFVYYTLDSFSDKFGWVRATEVCTADIKDPLWPSKLDYQGVSVFRNDCTDANDYTYADSDSWAVAYVEEERKFVALTTNRRFKEDSCLLYYESDDGISFERVSEINTDVYCGCHNCGLMSDGMGHIKKGDRALIGYAYSGSGETKWGVWATRFVPVKIDFTDEPDRTEDGAENLKKPVKIDESLLGKEPIMIVTDKLTYQVQVSEDPISINYYLMNEYRGKTRIDPDEVRIERYDKNILKLSDENRLIPIHEGVSIVRVEHNGLRREICVEVMPSEYDENEIRSFYPVCRRYDLKMSEPIILKVRPMAIYEDYDIHELSGYEINTHNLKFRSSDTSVCQVSKDGTIELIGPGTSVITVKGENCQYTLDVYVEE